MPDLSNEQVSEMLVAARAETGNVNTSATLVVSILTELLDRRTSQPVAWRWRETADDKWMVTTVPPNPEGEGCIVEPLFASPPSQGEPAGFEWTDAMYAAFNSIQAQKSHPRPDQLLAVWRALQGSAGHASPPQGEPVAVKAALRMMSCPRPCNNRPDDFDVGQCVDAGECGCVAGSALSPAPSLVVSDRWYLGSQNDGLFIINQPPRPSNDHPIHDRKDGPTLAIPIGNMAKDKAQAIVDAHNDAIGASHE